MPIRITGLNSGLDTEALVSELVSAYRTKTEKYTKAQTKLSWKQEAWKDLNSKVSKFYSKLGNLKYSSAYQTRTATVSDSTKATVSVKGAVATGTYSLKINEVARSGYLTGDTLKSSLTGGAVSSDATLSTLGYTGTGNISVTADGKTTNIEVNSSTTISDFVKSLNDAGVNASFDSKYQRIYVSSTKSGAENDFTLTGADDLGKNALTALGLNVETNAGAKRIAGADAEIELNGVTYTSNTNDFDINGISITALAKSTDEMSISVSANAQGLYDTIKDFIKEYNTLINEMTALYNADSAKGYEPLTSEEKDAMTDTEVEEWEKKIKDSLLRRDDSLSSLMECMKSAMFDTYTVNGKKYSLSSFGISTLGVLNAQDNEENAFHIDGDSEDSSTSGNTDKLLAALKEDPDAVIDFMKQLTTKMYDSIYNKMKTSTLSSFGVVYNDKEMAREYSDYTTTISKWEEKLSDLEDSYYKKFAAMESALATLQSQQSSLASLLG